MSTGAPQARAAPGGQKKARRPEGVYRPPAARPAQAPPARAPAPAPPASSNWAKLQERLGGGGGKKRPRPDEPDGRPVKPAKPARPPKPAHLSARVPMPPAAPVLAPPAALLTRELALDCEMVGVGASGTRSALAQVVICNAHEQVVYSTFVKPVDRVTDFRTHVSGVRSAHMARARPFKLVQGEVARLLDGRILVGHALSNDLKALMLTHPKHMMRDTALYAPLRRSAGLHTQPHALRHLAREHLGMVIQTGEHSPLEDAVAALRVYKEHREQWERSLQVRPAKKIRR